MDLLLINPGISKPSEPPSGIGRLTGFLKNRGVGVSVIDASVKGIMYLLSQNSSMNDTWTTRSSKRLEQNISALCDIKTYRNPGRYNQAVTEIERVLWAVSERISAFSHASLADFDHKLFSPVKSGDLLHMAEHPEKNMFYDYFLSRVIPDIESSTPKIIGISVNYLSQALSAFAIAGLIKRHFTDVRIIMGGGLISSWASLPDWHNYFKGIVDDVVKGPGEHFFSDVFRLKDTGSLCYDYDYSWSDPGSYMSPCSILPFASASRCFWNRCSFCQERASSSGLFFIDNDSAFKSLSDLNERYSPGLIHLVDSAVPVSFLNELAKHPILAPWYGFARVTPELADKEFCEALKLSGCRMLKLGIESGDQAVLDKLNKGIDAGIAAKAIKSLKAAGISTYIYLLFGTPPEDYNSALRTLDFVERNAESIDFINAAIFNMPASYATNKTMEYQYFYEGDLSLYRGFVHPLQWERTLVRRFLDRQFKRSKAVSGILKRTPKVFTSNHAPFF